MSDPTRRVPGFERPRATWTDPNRIRTEQGKRNALRKRKIKISRLIVTAGGCNQSIRRVVEERPKTGHKGGVEGLEATNWLSKTLDKLCVIIVVLLVHCKLFLRRHLYLSACKIFIIRYLDVSWALLFFTHLPTPNGEKKKNNIPFWSVARTAGLVCVARSYFLSLNAPCPAGTLHQRVAYHRQYCYTRNNMWTVS